MDPYKPPRYDGPTSRHVRVPLGWADLFVAAVLAVGLVYCTALLIMLVTSG